VILLANRPICPWIRVFCCRTGVFWCKISLLLPQSTSKNCLSPHEPTSYWLIHPLQSCLPHAEIAVYGRSLSSFPSCFSKAWVPDPDEAVSPFPFGLGVSLGFRPRPSLSVYGAAANPRARSVSLGFRPRPSLSGPSSPAFAQTATRVAGVSAPAFVERRWATPRTLSRPRVAGVSTPAFVERQPKTSGTLKPGLGKRFGPARPGSRKKSASGGKTYGL